EGRIDHMAADVPGHRLFVAALGNNTLEVVDLTAGSRIHSIRGLHEPQGIAYLEEGNRLYVANGENGKLEIFDAASFELLESIGFSGDADNVRFDAAAKELYVGYGSGALGIVAVAAAKRVADILLAGHPESFQRETAGPRLFVNVPSAGH